MNEYTKERMLKKLRGFTYHELYLLQIARFELDFNEESNFKNYEESLHNVSQEYRGIHHYPDLRQSWQKKLKTIDITALYKFFDGYRQSSNPNQPDLLEEVISELNNTNQLLAIERFNKRYDDLVSEPIDQGNLYAEVNNTCLYELGESEDHYIYKIYRENDQFIGIIESDFYDGSECRFLTILKTNQEIFNFFGDDALAYQLYSCAQINIENL
jgi:hypothetical protein